MIKIMFHMLKEKIKVPLNLNNKHRKITIFKTQLFFD